MAAGVPDDFDLISPRQELDRDIFSINFNSSSPTPYKIRGSIFPPTKVSVLI